MCGRIEGARARSWVVWLGNGRRHVVAAAVKREEGTTCWDFGRGVDQKAKGCFVMDDGGEGLLSRLCDGLRAHGMTMVENLWWAREGPFARH